MRPPPRPVHWPGRAGVRTHAQLARRAFPGPDVPASVHGSTRDLRRAVRDTLDQRSQATLRGRQPGTDHLRGYAWLLALALLRAVDGASPGADCRAGASTHIRPGAPGHVGAGMCLLSRPG